MKKAKPKQELEPPPDTFNASFFTAQILVEHAAKNDKREQQRSDAYKKYILDSYNYSRTLADFKQKAAIEKRKGVDSYLIFLRECMENYGNSSYYCMQWIESNIGEEHRSISLLCSKEIDSILAAEEENTTVDAIALSGDTIEESPSLNIQVEQTSSDQVKAELIKYNFNHFLEHAKKFTAEQIARIYVYILDKEIPVKIALLKEVGYLDYFKKEYCQGNATKRDKLMGSILMATPRRIKGNINVLNIKTKEDKDQYTSHKYTEDVKEVIKNL